MGVRIGSWWLGIASWSMAAALMVSACAEPQGAADTRTADQPPDRSLVSDAAIRARSTTQARAPLGPDAAAASASVPTFERPGRIPNYLRVLAAVPDAPAAFANAFRAMLFDGTVEPETKAAMGLQIGHELQSPYVVAHMRRILAASGQGRALLDRIEGDGAASPARDAAIRYASWLTADVHGVDDRRFGEIRAHYTDPQIVELTLVVSFFNYFTRLVEATRLPLEPWAFESDVVLPAAGGDRRPARVGMLTDDQIRWAASVAGPQSERPERALEIVNSQRAMNLVPDVTAAWLGFTTTVGRQPAVDRELRLHVSFAVSMANGCRYCTLHQVQGLRRLNVSPEKLLQMRKDDSALTPRELAAVVFARKLTASPSTVTDADYAALEAEFGERGALDVVLQTANFAFMNRFTDNLGLPSEDEAIQVYRDVYGTDFE